MKKVKIFLASSSELVEDRRAFEIFLNRRNKALVEEGIFLNLVIWEDFLDAMSKTRLQDEYNKALKQSDIFVMLFYTKVGMYTEEEFNTAYEEFQESGKPLIFTYFKDALGDIEPQESLKMFKDRLSKMGHFFTVYKNIEGLQLHFMEQLEKLEQKGFLNGAGVKEEAEPSKKEDTGIFKKIRMEVANGNSVAKILTKYGQQLSGLTEDQDLQAELITLQSNSTKLARSIRRNVISSTDANVETSKLTNAFLDILNEMENAL